jgi:sucrose-6-phosphate hydrolase SacC (GH32 family)
MFIIIGLCIAATGCIGGDGYASTDISVSKFDSSGQNIWSTKIDSGKDDYATAVIETSDEGYAIAGWISDMAASGSSTSYQAERDRRDTVGPDTGFNGG